MKTELESSKKWNEHWGTLFAGNVPNDYKERVEFLEEELKKYETFSDSVFILTHCKTDKKQAVSHSLSVAMELALRLKKLPSVIKIIEGRSFSSMT